MTKRSAVKSVSFADTDYERGLLDFATKPEHGAFSGYIKRLIERDRAGVTTSIHVQATPATTAPERPARKTPTEQDRSAALDML